MPVRPHHWCSTVSVSPSLHQEACNSRRIGSLLTLNNCLTDTDFGLLGDYYSLSFQVLRISVKDGHVTSVLDFFKDDGKLLSASTIAAYHAKTSLLIVGNLASKAAYCDVKYLSYRHMVDSYWYWTLFSSIP